MTVQKDVELTIRSRSGGGQIEQKVRGRLYERDGRWMYHYREPDSEMGRVTAVLKVESGLIRLLRQGDIRSEQQFAPGQRLPGYYDTPHGRLELEAMTYSLRTELAEGIGRVIWGYELYVSGEPSGRMELEIEIQELPV
ncbi:DUF1934 domain-containing protein [Gorillibacterium sp. sgz5001074]|uniref:DUF1934 domain-containing protein n=1 Tax=Gorillibacterium sp. sgz5001074 TaxID=3446695 RepID=UPI003F66BDEE